MTREAFGPVGEQVDRAVDTHDGKEQRRSHENEEQARRELANHLCDGQAGHERADAEGRHERDEPGVDLGERADGEGRDQHEEGEEWDGHDPALRVGANARNQRCQGAGQQPTGVRDRRGMAEQLEDFPGGRGRRGDHGQTQLVFDGLHGG